LQVYYINDYKVKKGVLKEKPPTGEES
jgi:hypothetical protein